MEWSRWRRQDGQASVELVAVLPLLVLVALVLWQVVVAGSALWAVGDAARAGARAAALGQPAEGPARARLGGGLAAGARVAALSSGAVRVSAGIPLVLAGSASLGRVSATARFAPQR
jgi:hypothetical protein